ncbi:multidrug resistance protein MdtN [Methyloligella halotolerans]|uniref:Multidrug resistance protein MdtN n=1 Tax=Methyloligella halotolerans TaxID=1177755 RepID=A0A1E2RXS2_9HYPH|nr:HlyD family secretion protein [Methyloligella halotolerans]ODA67021.1 multidrug resistance protein MdtN [Methyloligella halotolerans]
MGDAAGKIDPVFTSPVGPGDAESSLDEVLDSLGETAGTADPQSDENDVAGLLKRLNDEIRRWDEVPPDALGVTSAGEIEEDPATLSTYATEAAEAQARPVRQFLSPERAVPTEPSAAPAPPAPVEAKEPVSGGGQKAGKGRVYLSRGIKTALLLAVLVVLGWAPLQRLWQTSSAEASVNARVITLRSPIDGTLSLPDGPVQVGATVNADAPIALIDNPRADRTRLDDLTSDIADLKLETQSLQTRISQLTSHAEKLTEQRDAFQTGRVEQLEAQKKQYEADIVAAKAEEKEAASMLSRAKRLRERGFQTEASYDTAVMKEEVATSRITSLEQKLIGTNVELEAARRGLFVGDSYNDIPRTAQRLDEITQELVTLRADHAAKVGRIAVLQKELADVRKRYEALSSATIAVPATGRLWEVLTANHEVVSHGQPLFKLLDCGGALVTATVSESTYNALKLGQPATFHLRGDSAELPGHIVALNGLADVPSNLALGDGVFSREPYHVSVAVPGLAEQPDCYFGRTGKVTFDTSAGAGAVAAAAQ